MADIVNSIFGLSSQDLRQQQMQNDQAFASSVANIYKRPSNRLGALIGANIGQGLARGLFNIQDPQIQAAQDFEAALAEAQQNSKSPAEAMQYLADKLGADPRFSRQAAMAKMQAQQLNQEQALNQAKIAAETAKANKETSDKRPEIVRLLEARKAYEALGETDSVKVLDDLITKNTYIAEKQQSTNEIVNSNIYQKFLQDAGGDAQKAAFAYNDYETNKKKEVVAAGIPEGGTDFQNALKFKDQIRQDLQPYKESVDKVREGLAIAGLASKGDSAANLQLDSYLLRLTQDGKLSNQDFNRVMSVGGFDQRLTDSISRFFEGRPSDLTVGQKVQILNTLLKVKSKDLNEATANFRDTFSSGTNLPSTFVDKALKGYTFSRWGI